MRQRWGVMGRLDKRHALGQGYLIEKTSTASEESFVETANSSPIT